jgi:hypothetical protein
VTEPRVILDTDVASLSIKHRLPAWLAQRLLGAQLGTTFVTFAELIRWAELRAWGTRRRAELEDWLAARPTLPYSDDVAQRWGVISAHAIARGRPRPQNDTWVAASCLTYDLPLATLNLRDFADFAEHEGLRLILPPEPE